MEHKGMSSVTIEKKRVNIRSPLLWEMVEKTPEYTVLESYVYWTVNHCDN